MFLFSVTGTRLRFIGVLSIEIEYLTLSLTRLFGCFTRTTLELRLIRSAVGLSCSLHIGALDFLLLLSTSPKYLNSWITSFVTFFQRLTAYTYTQTSFVTQCMMFLPQTAKPIVLLFIKKSNCEGTHLIMWGPVHVNTSSNFNTSCII